MDSTPLLRGERRAERTPSAYLALLACGACLGARRHVGVGHALRAVGGALARSVGARARGVGARSLEHALEAHAQRRLLARSLEHGREARAQRRLLVRVVVRPAFVLPLSRLATTPGVVPRPLNGNPVRRRECTYTPRGTRRCEGFT